jgi:hypothetical protein
MVNNGNQTLKIGGWICEYEMGILEDDHVLELFQYLVDSGLAWTLQGSYGRMAESLIDQGLIKAA